MKNLHNYRTNKNNNYQRGLMLPPRKISKKEVVLLLERKLNPISLVELGEEPSEIRHACLTRGVLLLDKKEIKLYNFRVIYSLCSSCGRLIYYIERCD